MPVFKYTLKKYLVFKSTWVVTILTAIIVFAVCSVSFQSALGDKESVTLNKYITVSLSLYAGMATFFALFGAIFTAFTGARVFRDEIEDGTFLIVLSKPVSRGRIIVEKWLAYATIIIFYSFILTFVFTIAALIFDKIPKTNPYYSQIESFSVAGNLDISFPIIFAIGLVICFIFSSLALMFSTKMSVGATIGLTAGLGVVIPATNLLGLFASKTTHTTSFVSAADETSSIGAAQFLSNIGISDGNQGSGSTSNMNKGVKISFANRQNITINSLNDLANVFSYAMSGLLTNSFVKTANYQELYNGQSTPNGITDIGIRTSDSASYNIISYLDLNYQMTRLGNIASSIIIPSEKVTQAFQSQNSVNSVASSPQTSLKQKVSHTYSNTEINDNLTEMEDNIESVRVPLWTAIKSTFKSTLDPTVISNIESKFNDYFDLGSFVSKDAILRSITDKNVLAKVNQAIVPSDLPSKQIIEIFKSLANQKKIDKIEYVDFLNKYAILAVYLVVSVVLVPLSYWIVKRQDFK